MPSAIFTLFFLFLYLNALCAPLGAASITVSPKGGGAYTIQGEDMNGVSGIQLNVGYDSPTLSLPSVTQGSLVSGALLTANTTVPGSIKIIIVRPSVFSGSGLIATVSFATYGTPGGINTISARLIDTNGANVPVQASLSTTPSTAPITPANPSPTVQPVTTPVDQTPAGTAKTSLLATGMTILGTVTLPGDMQQKNEPKPPEPATNLPPPESTARPDDAAPRLGEDTEEESTRVKKDIEPKQISYASVLDRFKAYEGARTLAALVTLFDNPIAPDVRQEPSIAISDGSTPLKIYVTLSIDAGSAINFSLTGAGFVSQEWDDKSGQLVIEVLPKRNTLKASVTILTGQTITTYPLTVVSTAAHVSVKEADFTAFLKDNNSKIPKFDLTGDGAHDYLDDYVYTGNYWIKKKAAGKK